jgi:hypothetical protein
MAQLNRIDQDSQRTRSFRLAIDVDSAEIDNGLGYMIAFSVPKDCFDAGVCFETTPEFALWRKAVIEAVTQSADQPFSPDNWTRKVAIAELMNELARLNDSHVFQIGHITNVAAVEIHSSNPDDPRLQLDFIGREGACNTQARHDVPKSFGKIGSNGRAVITNLDSLAFPFEPLDEILLPKALTLKPRCPRPPQM